MPTTCDLHSQHGRGLDKFAARSVGVQLIRSCKQQQDAKEAPMSYALLSATAAQQPACVHVNLSLVLLAAMACEKANMFAMLTCSEDNLYQDRHLHVI